MGTHSTVTVCDKGNGNRNDAIQGQLGELVNLQAHLTELGNVRRNGMSYRRLREDISNLKTRGLRKTVKSDGRLLTDSARTLQEQDNCKTNE